MKIKIGPYFVGQDETMFTIAEARANYNQNFDMVKRLIDVAADAKADAVKFQTYSAETLYSKEALVLPIKDVGW